MLLNEIIQVFMWLNDDHHDYDQDDDHDDDRFSKVLIQ